MSALNCEKIHLHFLKWALGVNRKELEKVCQPPQSTSPPAPLFRTNIIYTFAGAIWRAAGITPAPLFGTILRQYPDPAMSADGGPPAPSACAGGGLRVRATRHDEYSAGGQVRVPR